MSAVKGRYLAKTTSSASGISWTTRYTTQNQVFIEPILNFNTGAGDNVTITANGQLGHTLSSRRFKDRINDMGDSSSKLFQLHPVSFFYKPQYDDGSHLLQYGLIAEDVAKVYPEMVVYDKQGQPYTVKYQMLTPMLLNEMQKEHTVVMAQQDELQTQLRQIKAQRQGDRWPEAATATAERVVAGAV